MENAIKDRDAITFSREFYTALGFGRSLESAFVRAGAGARLEATSREATPLDAEIARRDCSGDPSTRRQSYNAARTIVWKGANSDIDVAWSARHSLSLHGYLAQPIQERRVISATKQRIEAAKCFSCLTSPSNTGIWCSKSQRAWKILYCLRSMKLHSCDMSCLPQPTIMTFTFIIRSWRVVNFLSCRAEEPTNPTKQHTAMIVFPRTTEHISEVVKISHRRWFPMTPFSGSTSLRVPMIRGKPAKNHSAKVLTESVVGFSSSSILPRLAAI
jgi:hypothetical protein